MIARSVLLLGRLQKNDVNLKARVLSIAFFQRTSKMLRMKLNRIIVAMLRIALGWVYFYAGWIKVITYFTPAKDWSATMFLNNLNGPLAPLFRTFGGNLVVDYLNSFGLLALGIALIIGLFVRFASGGGVLLMAFYYLAGYPPENAFIIDVHVIYSVGLILLSAFGAGKTFGLDRSLEQSKIVASNKWLLKLLG